MYLRTLLVVTLFLTVSLQHTDSQEYWVPFTEDNMWGIKDGKGNLIVEAIWDSIILDNPVYDYFDDLILYLKDNKFGIINIHGKELMAPEWDAIYFNPGLGYEYNAKKDYQTETGYRSISYLSIAEIGKTTLRNYSSLPLYFIIARKGTDFYIFDKSFSMLIQNPVSNVFIEADIFIDYGLMILEKDDKMGIMYQSGRKFTGFSYESVSYRPTYDFPITEDHCYLTIDGRLVSFSVNGKIDYDQVNLVLPECIGQYQSYQDTRSWIFDFVVENDNVLVTDGNSSVYCFSSEKDLHWSKEIPDVYSYTPVASSGKIIIGNFVYKKSNISADPVILPGKNILYPAVHNDFIIYIAETKASHELENTEVPGLYDIHPSMMGSELRIICYNTDNQSIVWNRSLDKHYPSELPFQVYSDKIIMPVFGPVEDPGNYVLVFEISDGTEQARFEFEESQRVKVSGNNVYLLTWCPPESDIMCDQTVVKAYADFRLDKHEFEFEVRSVHHQLVKDDHIFYLDNKNRIIVLDPGTGKKVNKFSLNIPGGANSTNDPERYRLLAAEGGKLFFLINEAQLYSIELSGGNIEKYAFYVDEEWTTFSTKNPVIQGDKMYFLDQEYRINVFDIPK